MGQKLLNEIRIESISEAFIESYRQCLDSVARERKYLAFVEAPTIYSTRSFVLSNISKNVPQFIAIREDEVIGWCDILPNGMEGFMHCGRLGMGVQKEFRRQGIGRKLSEQTISEAREQGLERIELEVLASNTPAISLYEKLGFQVEGVKKNARKLDGIFDDLVEMALFF
jgi:ribosomal protein S18 acetylase RimI-like enzyme